jgi:hypothetical protein
METPGTDWPPPTQNTPHQDDLERHAASPDRIGSLGLGRLGCPDHVVRKASMLMTVMDVGKVCVTVPQFRVHVPV